MTSAEVRRRFLAFFAARGHAILPSAPLVPENDPTVLFNTAGMQPLVPYLMGRPHPQGDKLADVQKCVRTGDIDDIGDNRHLTFFEMLGNWSLGSYFKEEAIRWSYELLTSKTEGFGLDPNRLYVTVFAGDQNAAKDDEAANIWESVGMPKHRIYYKDASANWWPAVKGQDTWTGPTGPCSEMFYDVTEEGLGDLTPAEYDKADDEGKVIEIWNDVFMEFEKREGKIIGKLAKKNVDTGAGLERICAILQKKSNVFETDIFAPVMALMKSPDVSVRSKRIIADHLRASMFLVCDGVLPSNTDQGYILRRLIRRAIMNTSDKMLDDKRIGAVIDTYVSIYKEAYPELVTKAADIKRVIGEEAKKFSDTLTNGMKEFEKMAKSGSMSGADAFVLFSSYGFPIDLTIEMAKGRGITVDKAGFDAEFKKHQDLSRAGAEQKFKGGLGDTSEMSLKYHTATHLLHQALRQVLGSHVQQKGSNITPERLRFDFTHPAKMTDDEKRRVEEIVNANIQKKLPVHRVELPKAEAEKTGALHFFGDKYGDVVSVYYIGDSIDSAVSKEFCGGPHVENTGTLGMFKIQKEEAVSAGVRRIKAVLV
ncbi:MAG TPA: alanine--tRNA ligase [Candidatus Paceibacterota bacterium]|jgi:alanine--tRNA ligase